MTTRHPTPDAWRDEWTEPTNWDLCAAADMQWGRWAR